MHIWVDADACPAPVKEILFRAAARTGVSLTLVANQSLRTPPGRNVRSIRVASGFDVADAQIASSMQAGDLVITADIPLAAQVVEKGGLALNPRGELYTGENVRQHLSTRNFLQEMRDSGIVTGGPASFTQADRQAFANQLDRLLAKHGKTT